MHSVVAVLTSKTRRRRLHRPTWPTWPDGGEVSDRQHFVSEPSYGGRQRPFFYVFPVGLSLIGRAAVRGRAIVRFLGGAGEGDDGSRGGWDAAAAACVRARLRVRVRARSPHRKHINQVGPRTRLSDQPTGRPTGGGSGGSPTGPPACAGRSGVLMDLSERCGDYN